MKYRKKPVVIDAVQWTGVNADEVLAFTGTSAQIESSDCHGEGPPRLVMIDTLEGRMAAGLGDWIIRGVKGEFYPCKPDVFEATYEPVLVVDCLDHRPVQHRDARPPWCKACGLTADGREPVGLLDKDGEVT